VQPGPLWQWSVAFLGSFVLFLPATAAMGATLPAMERITHEQQRGEAGRSIAALYASNTFGAVLGGLCAAFWLIPQLGLARTAGLCIALNLLCGATAPAVFSRSVEPAPSDRAACRPWRTHRVVLPLAVTGLLGIGYEVVVVRVLSQVTENTVYTFALLLAVYLVGGAIGAAGYQRLLQGRRDQERLTDRLLTTLAAACLIGAASLWGAEQVKAAALHALGPGLVAGLAAEVALALLAFGLPTIVMGALFSHLCRRAVEAGASFSLALGVNTLGAAVAPVVFGVLAVPALGPKLVLLLIGVGYLTLVQRRFWFTFRVALPALVALALALGLLAPRLAFVDVPPGSHVVSYQDGVMAAVSVVEDADGIARLRINNRQQEGSSATQRVDGRQAWLPLLLHPGPRQALFLGLGTGVTASSAAQDPLLQVDAVELLPEVIEASALFTRGFGEVAPRLHLLAADARRYVRASDKRYDVIVADNFHPARSGSGSLYTVEHFQAIRRRLAPEGLFCQWLPLHQLDLPTLRSIVQSYLAVYPQASAMLANNGLETPVLGLLARADAGPFDAVAVRRRLRQPKLAAALEPVGLEDELAVLGSFVAGPRALQRFAGGATANTDDRPVVAYGAPWATYAQDARPRDRLLTLLRELSSPVAPAESGPAIVPPPEPAWPARLTAYWRARNRFIELGRDVRPAPNVQAMLAQVRAPLLAVLRISPDFRPAYDPLLAMASALARTDPAGGRALLAELLAIQPARDEASRALQTQR
jgi:spermidine synthase